MREVNYATKHSATRVVALIHLELSERASAAIGLPGRDPSQPGRFERRKMVPSLERHQSCEVARAVDLSPVIPTPLYGEISIFLTQRRRARHTHLLQSRRTGKLLFGQSGIPTKERGTNALFQPVLLRFALTDGKAGHRSFAF